MRAGPAPVWLERQGSTTRRPDPADLLLPMLALVLALASPVVAPLPASAVLVLTALVWTIHRARSAAPTVLPWHE